MLFSNLYSKNYIWPNYRKGGCIMPRIMTTKEISEYLRVHKITICKYAAQGVIPAIRVGRVWRFEKGAIDRWISEGGNKENPV